MILVAHWFRAFAWTLGIELLVAGVLLRAAVPAVGQRASLIVIANVATHPAVWLIFPELGHDRGWPRLVTLGLSEVWAFGFEAFVYGIFLGPGKRRAAIAAAVAANAASLGLGLLLRAFGWV
jgi:hypothetical protein